MIKTFVLLSLCGVALSLRCYSCEPKTDDNNYCLDPHLHNIATLDCDADETNRAKSSIYVPSPTVESSVCFTLHLKALEGSKAPTGIYRGCGPLRLSETNCTSALDADGVSGTISYCRTCSEDNCNTENGAASLSIPMVSVVTTVFWFFFSRL